MRWFNRTSPNDSGYPVFLFEWTLILFKTGNLKEAEKKAFHTIFANDYLFDKFTGKTPVPKQTIENSNWETTELSETLKYTKDDPEFAGFAAWLELLLAGKKFRYICRRTGRD